MKKLQILLALAFCFAVNLQAQTVTTGTVSTTLCAGATVTVPYTITGTFTSGNVFFAQLSNSAGSFTSPVAIGTLTSTAAGTITARIPSSTVDGSGYRIRVVSSSPVRPGSSNTTNITVNALPSTPTITAGGATTICSGGSVILSAVKTPLDDVSGATLAVGLRKLKSSYTGSALRLRRSTDNAEMDFGFVGYDLDISGISTWLNGASGFCTVLYDQSGNSGNVTQTVATSQPLLVLTGINSKPVLRFTTAQTMFNDVNYTTPYSVVYGSRVIGTSRRVLAAKNNNWLLGYVSGKMDMAYFDGFVSTSAYDPLSSTNPSTVLNQYNVYAASGTGAISTFYKNGVQLFSNSGGLSSPNGIQLNGTFLFSIDYSDCEFTDVLIYGSALSATDIGKVNTSVVDYYSNTYLWSTGATTPTITATTSGNYTVQITNAIGCQSAASAVTSVTVSTLPTISNAGADQTGSATCGLTQVTLAGNTPSVGTGAWSIVSGTGGTITAPSSSTSTFTGTAGATYTLRWTISNSPCTASTDDVVIKFNLNPGNFGNALSFDGSDDNVSIPNTAGRNNFASSNKFTIECWVKVFSDVDERGVFINKGGGGGLEQYCLDIDVSLRFYVKTNTGFNVLQVTRPTVAEGWVHLAGIYDGENGSLRLYKNGILIASSNSAGSTLNSNTNPLSFGTQANSINSPLRGAMDEVRIWNTVRTEAQIQSSMNSELAGTETGLVAYYNFNQGIAGGGNTILTTLNDGTSNGNNGTLTNMALTGSTSNWVSGNSFTIAAITGTSSICSNATTQMADATLGGVWSFPNSTSATVNTTGLVSGVAAGSPTLSYTLTSSAGCTSAATQVITVSALPTITASSTATAVCQSTSAQTTPLTYSVTTGSPISYSISWSGTPTNSFVAVTNATLPTSPISITVPANTAAGTYTGTLTVKNANGCASAGTSFTVTVNALPTSGGTIATAQSGASPFTPAAFTNSAAASGQTGTLEYKWQSSTTSNSTGFIDISSSNAATYTSGALTVTTWFKRLARVTCSADWTGAVASNVIEVTITNCANPTSGGTIATAQIGYNPFTPAAFTSSAAASGQTGTLEYKWQSSTTSNSTGFTDISSSNAATNTSGALTVTTWFKRLARVSCKSDWTGAVASNVLEVTVGVIPTNGPDCDTYTNKTTTNGLGHNAVNDVYTVDNTVYAATNDGLSISTDGGAYFTNKTTANGLGSNSVNRVFAVGSTVYAATFGGLSISTNSGVSFSNKTFSNGLGANQVNDVYAIGSTVYGATGLGLSISTNNGTNFTNKTTANGLGNNIVKGVYAVGSTVYAATNDGLSISTDGGANFTNKTTANGLGSNYTYDVYAVGSTVYVATGLGLSISTDGGTNFKNKRLTSAVYGVYVSGSTVYAATAAGLNISTDGGANFTNKTTTNGLGSSIVNLVYASRGKVYAATAGGVSFCSDPICIAPTAGGTIAAAQSGYDPFTPSAFTSTAAPSGQSGTLEYKWQSSTTSNSAGFSDISSSNAATYNSGALTQPTWFKRLARMSGSELWTCAVASNVIEITVIDPNCINNPTSGGTIAGAQSGTSPFFPAAFINSVAPSGQTGTLEYKWQSSTTSNSTGFEEIASSNAATYSAGILTKTTWFKRLARVSSTTPWTCSVASNVIEVTVISGNAPNCDNYTSVTASNGLGDNSVYSVSAVDNTIYVATWTYLSISRDGGATFTNKKLGSALFNEGVYAIGSTVYVATTGGLSISTDGGLTFTNKTNADGLAAAGLKGVYASGSNVYAATTGGLSISTDGGSSFTNKTTANGLGNNSVKGVFAIGSTVYAATTGGLSISTNGGSLFTNKTTANGLGSNIVNGVYVIGSTVYAATTLGLSISTNGGSSFTNKTTANGLGGKSVLGVYAIGSTVYAATSGGLSISTDGGTSFTNKTTANGLAGFYVYGVYASVSKVYLAIQGGLSFCTVSSCIAPTSGGSIAAAQSGTNPFTPAAFTSTAAASGLAQLEYKWQSSTTSNSTGFADIASSNAAAYTSGALINTTWFKRLARIAGSTDWSCAVASNVIEVTVPCTNPTSGGAIAGAQISTNPFTPRAFTSGAEASGQIGTLEYKWQSSTINNSTGFADIASSNADTYTAGILTKSHWFKRLARVTCSANWTSAAESNVIEVTVGANPNGPVCDTYTNKTTTNGLGSNTVYGVYTVGSTVYTATTGGLSISTDGGLSFTNKTTTNGLGNNTVNGVYANGSWVYAATEGGLSISTNGGSSFTNKTTANGLGNNAVKGVFAIGSKVYAATTGGLSISTDGGVLFTNKTTAKGLGSNSVQGVYAVGSTVYAATYGGLSKSTDGGVSFTNKTTSNGLGSNTVNGVYVLGSTVYAATTGGLSISTDGGATFTNKTTTDGLGTDNTYKVYAFGSTVYAATWGGGLGISTDYGANFTNKTTSNGLGNNLVRGAYTSGNMLYVATSGGLSFCSAPICIPPNSGGTIAAAQSGTNPFTPAAFTSTTAASGLVGTLEYKWQSSTISNSTGFADIASSNVATYTAGSLTQTTWFRRLARVSCSADWSSAVSSNVIAVTVNVPNCTNPTSGGTIANAQNGTSPFTPAAFTSSAAPSGQIGPLEYKWQSSTTSNSTGFADIASSNVATYKAGTLTQTTWFKRLARVTCSSNWIGAVESNVLEVTVIDCINSTAGINNPSTTEITCINKSISLTATGGGTYSWSDGTTVVGTNATLNVTSPATYTVNITSSNGCTVTREVAITGNVTVASIFNRDKTTELTCENPEIGLRAIGGLGGGTYSWSNGTTVVSDKQIISVSTPGIYTVTITETNGCSATDEIIITQSPDVPPIITIKNNRSEDFGNMNELTCSRSSITLTASGGEYYYWKRNNAIVSTDAELIVTQPSEYEVTVRSERGGCPATKSVTITNNGGLYPQIRSNTGTRIINCNNTAIILTAFSTIDGDKKFSGNAEYTWSNGSTVLSTVISSEADLSVTEPGTYTVTVGNIGCTFTSSISITKNIATSTSARLYGSTSITNGQTANLSVGITGGQEPFEIVISDGTSNDTTTKYYPLKPIIFVRPTTTTNYTLVSVTGKNGCDGTGNDATAVEVKVGTPNKSSWTGNYNNYWGDGRNWSSGTIPDDNDDITIGTSEKQPILNINFNVRGSLTLSGTGTTLTVQAGKSLSVGLGATVDFGGKEVTFKSDAIGTAQLGRMVGTLINASNVVVERYFPAGRRAYRMISPSVTSTTSIQFNWMEDAIPGTTEYPYAAGTASNPKIGYGTHITGTGGNANGFDATTTNSYSVQKFSNVGQYWSPLSNTNGTLTAGEAYNILIRGDRSINLKSNIATATSTTLRTRGTLKTGIHVVTNLSSAWGGWNLIGNPYNAQVDMRDVRATNMTPYYTVWDPQSGTRGAYVSYHFGTGIKSNQYSNVDNLLQPGQAFLVQTRDPGEATFTFEERDKTPAGVQTSVFSPTTVYPVLNSALYYTDSLAKNQREMDAFGVVFDYNFSNDVDGEDGKKNTNIDENMSVNRNGALLSLEMRSMYNDNTVIPVNITNFKRQNYTMRLAWDSPVDEGYEAKLVDNYNGTETAINFSGNTDYVFTVNSSIPGSIAADRFKIVFVSNVALPVSGLTLTGSSKGNAVVLQYEALNERDMQVYEIERSADGTVFTKLGEQQPVNGTAASNRYNYNDNNPLAGVNYYRIKGSSINGQLQYSNIITVKTGSMKPSVTVAPNPIANKVLNLKLLQLNKGSYRITVTDVAGRTIYSKEMVYDGVSSAIKTSLPVTIKPGNYYVRLSGEGSDFTEKFIIQ